MTSNFETTAEFRDWLLAKLSPDGSLLPAVHSALSMLSGPGKLESLLSSALADPVHIREMAAGSYRHALGFSKLLLVTCDPVFRLRLHLWDADSIGLEHIHNHRFAVGSVVVYGGLDVKIYARSENGDSYAHFRERIKQAERVEERRWLLEKAGEEALELQIQATLAKGSTYLLPPQSLHCISVRGGETATVFLETRTVSAGTDVYISSHGDSKGTPSREPVSEADFIRRVNATLSKIRNL